METPLTENKEIDWSLCTWEGARRSQLLAFAKLPFRRKMEALEEMCDLARYTIAQRRKKGLPYMDPYTGQVVRPPFPEQEES